MRCTITKVSFFCINAGKNQSRDFFDEKDRARCGNMICVDESFIFRTITARHGHAL
jgi:hypothetical protein